MLLLSSAVSARAAATRCWFENGSVVVPAAFGDMAGDFVFDLSAPKSQLNVTRAQADGVEASTARGDLVIGGALIEDFPMEVVDLDARSKGFVTNIVGVLGADVAMGPVVDLQFSPCRVTFGGRRASRPARALRLRTRVVDGIPAVWASISDGQRATSGLFAIDTASQGMRLDDARLSRNPPGLDSTSRTHPPGRLRALSLAGRLFEQTPAGLTDEPRAGLAGGLGNAIWSAFRLRLDIEEGWLELAPRQASRSGRGPSPGR